METASPTARSQPRWSARLTAFGFAGLLLGWILSSVVESKGAIFGGVDIAVATLISGCSCALGLAVVAVVWERRGRVLSWLAGLLGAAILSVITVAAGSHFSTRKNMEILLNPMPMPADLRVHRGQSFLHGAQVHFTGTPAFISALIQAKHLAEVPAAPPDGGELDLSGFSARRQSAEERGWWRPTSMPGAKFYYLHHKSQAIQGWAEGWWVSGATNEVFAFIGG